MTIYLACTVRGDRGGVLAGRAICETLHHRGHEVLTTHLLADDVEAAESRLTAGDVYRRDLDWLTRCDVLVAEASGSSYGVGFEVGYVLGRAPVSGHDVRVRIDRRADGVCRADARLKPSRYISPSSNASHARRFAPSSSHTA
jgi:nucleoside 2-deoxyribosyltransferase